MQLSELGFYHYKARMYSPTLGRFLQTDPIGYADGLNWYDYVGGDPVNRVDPTGTDALCGFGRRAVYNRDNFTGQAQTSSTEIVVLAGYRCEADDDEIFFMASRQQGGAVFGPGQPIVPGSRQTPQSPKQCPANANPSRNFMHKSTNAALRSVPGGGRSGPLSTEFARVTQLPNFRSGGWSSVGSSHARQAFEHSLPGSDRVVKVYIGDSNFNGANTVTITSPTGSFEHYAEFPPYAVGYPVNTGNANDYWRDRLGCQ